MSSARMKSKMSHYMDESEIAGALQAMQADESFRTEPGYSIDIETYPDNIIPFIDEHVNYLKKHRHIDPAHYLSNLRLMLKIR